MNKANTTEPLNVKTAIDIAPLIPSPALPAQVPSEEVKLLVDAKREAARSFDQTMITLSAGALALSITFVREIASKPQLKWVLCISWVCFGLALISILLSFLSSQYAFDGEIKRCVSNAAVQSRSDKLTHFANWASIILFVVGVAFLLIFSIGNFA